jgi:hypothetical protein
MAHLRDGRRERSDRPRVWTAPEPSNPLRRFSLALAGRVGGFEGGVSW